jgi:hypothetical protein
MASRVTDLDPILGSNLSGDDEVHIVDVSDVSDHPNGSSFRITVEELSNFIGLNLNDLNVSGTFTVNNDEMSIGRFLRHKDDADTYMNMISNGIYFRAGGNGDNLIMNNAATILNGNGTKNTVIRTDNESDAIYVNNSNDDVTFNIDTHFKGDYNTIESTVPRLVFKETGVNTDEDIWNVSSNSTAFRIGTTTSASHGTLINSALRLERSGTDVTSFQARADSIKLTGILTNHRESGSAHFYREALDGVSDITTRYYKNGTLRIQEFYDVSAHLYRAYTYTSAGVSEGEVYRYGPLGFNVNPNGDPHVDFISEVDIGIGLMVDASANSVTLNPSNLDIDSVIRVQNGAAVHFNAGSNLVHFNSSNGDIDFRVDTVSADNAIQVDASANIVTFNAGYNDVDFRIGSNVGGLALWCYEIGATSSRVHWNYSGKNVDFRIDSQTIDNAFLIDANLNVGSFNVPVTLNDYLTLTGNGNALEGGQIQFPPATDYTGTISLDCYANQMRLFASSVNSKELNLFNTGTGGFNLNVTGTGVFRNSSSHIGLKLQQFSNSNIVIDNQDDASLFFRKGGSDRFILSNDVEFKNITNFYIRTSSNVHTDYPLEIVNATGNYALSVGPYGFSNKAFGTTNIDYKVDIGNDLIIDVGDECFIKNDAEGWSHVFSNGDLVLRSTNGGDMFQMVDAGATSATQCVAYGEINRSNGLGASMVRDGLWGFASSSNADFYLWNYSGGGFRIGCSGSSGRVDFYLDRLDLLGANGSEFVMRDKSAAVNNGIFDFRVDEGLLRGRIKSDAMDAYSNWLRVYTTDHTQIDEVELSGDIIDLNCSDYAVVRSELRVKPSSGNAYINIQTQQQTGQDAILDFICESATTRFRQYDGANSYMDIIDNGQFGTLLRFGLDNQGYVNVLGDLWINHIAYTIKDDTGNNAFRIRNGNSGDRISIESNGDAQICIDANNNMTGKNFIVYGNGNNINGTELLKLNENGFINIPGIYSNTTALGSNVYVNSNGGLFRTTSSKRYKKSIKPLPLEKAKRVLDMKPVSYKSKSEHDNSDYTYYGLIAEDLAELDPRLVTFDEEGKPDGVQYDRVVPMLVGMIQDLNSRLTKLEEQNA